MQYQIAYRVYKLGNRHVPAYTNRFNDVFSDYGKALKALNHLRSDGIIHYDMQKPRHTLELWIVPT